MLCLTVTHVWIDVYIFNQYILVYMPLRLDKYLIYLYLLCPIYLKLPGIGKNSQPLVDQIIFYIAESELLGHKIAASFLH